MDKQTEKVLKKISAKVPPHLAANTTKIEYDTTEEQLAILAINDPDTSPRKKRELQGLLDRGSFRRSEEVVNEETVQQLDKFHTREIAKARRTGRLADPMQDKFYRDRVMRARHMKRKDPNAPPAFSKEELRRAAGLITQPKEK